MSRATGTAAALPQKPESIPVEDAKTDPPRWTRAAFGRYLRGVWFRLKVLLLCSLAVYLIRHWFDYFCYPWTFDDILLARRVPWFPNLVIFGGAISWAWKHQTPSAFWNPCIIAAFVSGSELYFVLFVQDTATSPRSFATSILICTTVVLAAVFGHVKLIPEDIGTTPEARLREDKEAFNERKSVKHRSGQLQGPDQQSRTSSWSRSRRFLRNLPSTRTALLVALTGTMATMAVHPPDLAMEHLSAINCEAHATQLGFDDTHFEFIATDQNNTLTGRCNQVQQLWALQKVMNAHAVNTSATCGVWCLRQASSGHLFGYMSQVHGGLVDMYYCRGTYDSFGPDCEAEGEEYGYDTSREGWMNDIYQPWSTLEYPDALTLAGVEEQPYDDEGQ